MRAAARALALFGVLCGFATTTGASVAPAVNSLGFATGSPAPTVGGVDVTVNQKPAPGYTCTKITIRVIDDATGQTLATQVFNNPGASVSKSFTNLANNLAVQVTVDATFQNGGTFDTKAIDAVVTTK
jgi:hypothetical protein